MRIGIDCRTILNPDSGESAGVGHYTYFLVRHLLRNDQQNTYVLFFDNRVTDTKEFEQENVEIRRFAFSQYKKFLPFSYSHMLITAMLLKEKLDVFHAPANIIPLTYPKTSIVTIHDLAIYKNPAWFPMQVFSTRLLVPQSLRKAQHIIAVSESTKQDLEEIFGVQPEKMSVIYEAPFTDALHVKDRNVDILEKFRLTQPYILFVGTIDPRKNVEMLLEAFTIVRKHPELKSIQFILAGGKGYRHDRVLDRIAQLHLGSAIKYLGYVTHNEKLALLKNAAVFAFPSLYEGFGLPVLDAMKLGVPVVTSNVSSLPEVAGDAAIQVNPDDPKALAGALTTVLTDPQKAADMVRKGFTQAQKFNWDQAALQTLDVYRQATKKQKKTKTKKKQK